MIALLALLALAAHAEDIDGKAVFVAQGCARCHSVPAAGLDKLGDDTVSAPDLQGVAEDHRARWLKRWLGRDNSQHGNTHLQAFTGSDEELKALVDWLMEQ